MSSLSEDEIDVLLQRVWSRAHGRLVRAPTLRDFWQEQCRVAAKHGLAEPLFEEVREHFSWYFTKPELDEHDLSTGVAR